MVVLEVQPVDTDRRGGAVITHPVQADHPDRILDRVVRVDDVPGQAANAIGAAGLR